MPARPGSPASRGAGPERGCRSSDPSSEPSPGQRREPRTCAGCERRPAPPGDGGRRRLRSGGVGVLEVWVGRPRREAPARPRLCVLAGTAPSPGAADSQPRRAVRSLPTEAAGWRCRWTAGAAGCGRRRDGCHRAGAEPQPLLRTGQSSCPVPSSPGWPSTASPCGSRPGAIGGKAPCRAAEAAVGTRPWYPQDGEGSSLARQPGPP